MVKKIILTMLLLASSVMAAELHWAKKLSSGYGRGYERE
jgi:hypothetical protein